MKRTAILVLTVAALVLTVGALGVAGPGGAVAQTAAQDQYSAAHDQYSAAPDPYSYGGAVSPSVPGETAQVAQVLQQMLTLRGLLDAQQALQQDPYAQMVATGDAQTDQMIAELEGLAAASPGSTGASGPAPPINSVIYGELMCQRVLAGPTGIAPDTFPTMGDSPFVPTTPGVPDNPGATTMVPLDVIRACTTPINGLSPAGP